MEAGAELPTLVVDLAGQGLAGLEFAGNIPGSVGGAVVGNAGAYGRSVGDALVEVQLLDGRERASRPPEELAFGYRTSVLKSRPDLVVLAATFALTRGDADALLAEIASDAGLRRASIRSSTPRVAATSRTRRASFRRHASSRTPASRG